jgi:hypothetical protein
MSLFTQLWDNHPIIKNENILCPESTCDNVCAINLSASLNRCGMCLDSYTGAFLSLADQAKYALCAKQLALWLTLQESSLQTKVQKFIGTPDLADMEGDDGILGRSGIVFLQNYWGSGSEGSHIDLWDGARLTAPLSWRRIYARAGSKGPGAAYRKPQSVWFWPLQ